MNLVSERLTVADYDDAIEMFYERHWTDGLPVVLIPHRKGGETADDQRRKAEAALSDVVVKLVQPI
jgi:hypothetical protein